MTQEDKDLLLKDLFGRLLYGVKVGFNKKGDVFIPIKFDLQTKELFAEDKSNNCICIFRYDVFKPYLRPMSSMTEEEYNSICWDRCAHTILYKPFWSFYELKSFTLEVIDWLNEHHFDYRGLIQMGLALEAPEDMYK